MTGRIDEGSLMGAMKVQKLAGLTVGTKWQNGSSITLEFRMLLLRL